ncbi:regulator [Carboxylicivirga linearis]|uniref:Regulator n=1 Tax=Carboxylicivirga linearis TaxID=1628157 RepID=A0ABS5JRW2_9BACT|nr:regulator [Carboxylicivirga linearis]
MIREYLILQRVMSLLFVIIIANNSLVKAQTIRSFSKKDYHASSQNWSVDFDNEGHTYFCNNTGLLQFDGVTWKSFPTPNSSTLRTVSVDANNKVYTGGYRELGYWKHTPDNELKYQSLTNKVEKNFTPNEEFWNIFTINDRVVFHSFSKLYIYENDDFSIIQPGGFLNFATQINNSVYVTIYNRGIYKLYQKQLIPFIENDFLKDKLIRFLAQATEPDTYFIGTESNGLYTYNIRTNELKTAFTQAQSFLIKNQINKGIITPEGHVIIGTILDGIIAFDRKGNIVFHYNKENELQSNTVLGIGMDQLKNIWLALDNGIEFIPSSIDGKKRFFQSEELGAVYSAALYNNLLYIGTNQGLYTMPWNDLSNQFQLLDKTQGQIWDCKELDNRLFVGHNSGTFIIDQNDVEALSSFAGAYSITRHPLNPNILIQGTYNDLIVYKKINGKWQFSNTIKGFNNLIRYVEFDHLGNLWASHVYRGVYKLRLNEELDSIVSSRHYDKIDQTEENISSPKAFKVEGRIVLTSGVRMYTYDDLNDTIIPYSELNRYLEDFKSSHRIVYANKHQYWFINKSGMACFDIRPDTIIKLKQYPNTVFQNQLIPTHENVVQINDSNIIVCMENGFALLNPLNKSEGDRMSNYTPVLRQAYFNDEKDERMVMNTSEHIYSIPNRLNNLMFRYSFPIINGDPTSFQYKIQGLSNEWSTLSEKPIFEITRIPPGEYTFMVRAVNNWNKYSGIHQIKIIINKPWYQSWKAILLYFIIIAALLTLSRRITTRKIKLKEKRKREEKEREVTKLRNEKLSAELTHKSQQLAGSTMGIIKKNEFLMSLKDKIKRQKEALGTRYPDKYYTDLINKIDENISGQDDWHLFEANFEQAHEKFLKTLKSKFPELTPSDLRLCAYLRINLTSKDIAPLLGISVRGVENHRYRLRKKLGLNGDKNLVEFIINF